MAKESPVSLKNLTVLGKEHLPAGGGFLILPGQLSFIDMMRLAKLLEGREIVYLVEQGVAHQPLVSLHLEKENVHAMAIVPHATNADSYRSAIAEAAKTGAVIVYLPAEAAALPAPLTTVPGVKLEFLLKAGIPVVPLHVMQKKEAALPIERRYGEDETIFAFGMALHGPEANLASYQESMYQLSEQSFASAPGLDLSLGYAMLLGLKKHGTSNFVVDGKDDKTLRYDKVLAAALALSKIVKSSTSKKRVGIILPPGLGGLLCNLAVLFAGKVPVNLNFTAGRAAIDSAIRQGEIDRFLTADIFVRK
ncbi:MAG: 2-acyl-glycerophospho-ethanolamine acyltransferase, partial [Verrucomicrobiaceae bacterium]|nr:2-acyl-glycerophospho-ethanolamine acyltransferase [Verrucomicrobiaceae bacterium]